MVHAVTPPRSATEDDLNPYYGQFPSNIARVSVSRILKMPYRVAPIQRIQDLRHPRLQIWGGVTWWTMLLHPPSSATRTSYVYSLYNVSINPLALEFRMVYNFTKIVKVARTIFSWSLY